jgi:uncharacterized SAM-binding protein YcdF (DUF218 family)
MFFLQQALVQITSPLFLTIILIIVGFFTKRKFIIIFSFVFLILCSTPFLSSKLMAYVEFSKGNSGANSYDEAQAIVVLGGYVSIIRYGDSNRLQWGGADRFFRAVEYAKLHPELYLVFTNEKLPWMNFSKGTGELLANYAISFGVSPNKILITSDVKNTKDESVAVAKLLHSLGLEKIILVTSAFHMQRAKYLFSNAGLDAEPMLADVRGYSEGIGILNYLPSASALSISETAMREICLRVYYLLVENGDIASGVDH